MDYKLFNRQNIEPQGVRQQQQKVLDNPPNKAFRGNLHEKLRGLPNTKIHSGEVYQYGTQDVGQGGYNDQYQNNQEDYYAPQEYYTGYDQQYQQTPVYPQNQNNDYNQGININHVNADPYVQEYAANNWNNNPVDLCYEDPKQPYGQVSYPNQFQPSYDQQNYYPQSKTFQAKRDQTHHTHGLHRVQKMTNQQAYRQQHKDMKKVYGNIAQASWNIHDTGAQQKMMKLFEPMTEVRNYLMDNFNATIGLHHARILRKNMIPDMSAFSKSEKSISPRKKLIGKRDRDGDGDIPNLSNDIKASRGMRTEEKKFVRTKSHDDLQKSLLAGIKIDDQILRGSANKGDYKSGTSGLSGSLKVPKGSHNKKSAGGPTKETQVITTTPWRDSKIPNENKEKITPLSGPVTGVEPLKAVADFIIPVINSSTLPNTQPQSSPFKNELPQVTGNIQTGLLARDNQKRKHLRSKSKRKEQEQERLQPQLPQDKSKYNRDEAISNFLSLVASGGIDPKRGEILEKYDLTLGYLVKYIRFELLTLANNDHFISIKPEAFPYKDGSGHPDQTALQVPQAFKSKQPNDIDRPAGQFTKPSSNYPKKAAMPPNNANVPAYYEQGMFAQYPMYQTLENKRAQQPSFPGLGAEQYGAPTAGPFKPSVPPCDNDLPVLDKNMSIAEQAMHKTMTGKLQRYIKKLSDEEKVSLFKQLKISLPDLLVDQYGRYVVVLFLKTSNEGINIGITSIVDALIANFDKLIFDLMKNKNGYLFCQSLIEVGVV